ncbi:hypothetical protein [Paraglaciecola aestuariivivens]
MNWEAISTISQIVGVIVVIITLLYLAAQVRQGNIFAKLQVRQRMIEQQDQELYMQLSDPAITYASVREGPLTADEQAKLGLFLIAFLRQREWEWFQFQEGVLDERAYKAYHGVIAIHLGTERARKWWVVIGRQAFDPGFVKTVDSLLANSELNSYLYDMRTWDDA